MALHRIFFYLTIVFLPTQLGMHFWPDFSYVIGRRIDYLSPTIFLTDILLAATVLFWLIEQRCKHHALFRLSPAVALYLILIFANCIFSHTPILSVIYSLRITMLMGMGIYIWKTRPKTTTIGMVMGVPLLITSILAILQTNAQHSIGGLWWFLGERTFTVNTPGIARTSFCLPLITTTGCPVLLRPYAFLPHPNVLAAYIALSQFFFIKSIVALWPNAVQSRIVLCIFLCINIFATTALFFTYSRSGWIASSLLLSMVVLFSTKHIASFTKVAVLLISIFFLCITLLGVFTLSQNTEAVKIRADLIKSAVYLVQQNPVWGSGFSSFIPLSAHEFMAHRNQTLQPVHNIYLLFLVESGVYITIVTFLYVALWVKSHFKHIHVLNSVPVFIISITGFFDHYWLTTQQGRLMATIIVAMVLMESSHKRTFQR